MDRSEFTTKHILVVDDLHENAALLRPISIAHGF